VEQLLASGVTVYPVHPQAAKRIGSAGAQRDER